MRARGRFGPKYTANLGIGVVSAKARQFRHRLVSRKNAIIHRREAEAAAAASASEASRASVDPDTHASNSPTSTGFTAVNSRPPPPAAKDPGATTNGVAAPASNGRSSGYTAATASPSIKAELMSYFTSQRERQTAVEAAEHMAPYAAAKAKAKSKPSLGAGGGSAADIDYAAILLNSASPVPIPHTPAHLAQHGGQPRPGGGGGSGNASSTGGGSAAAAAAADRFDDSGPFKAEMLARMDSMQRGDRVRPPCDRCRRLHMDCLKNLTACLGCTKKHAKCSWKEVSEQELLDNPHVPRVQPDGAAAAGLAAGGAGGAAGGGAEGGYPSGTMALDGPPLPVRDEELLGEDSEDEAPPAAPTATADAPNGTATPSAAPAPAIPNGAAPPSGPASTSPTPAPAPAPAELKTEPSAPPTTAATPEAALPPAPASPPRAPEAPMAPVAPVAPVAANPSHTPSTPATANAAPPARASQEPTSGGGGSSDRRTPPPPPASAADVEASAREILRRRLGTDIHRINHGGAAPLTVGGLFDAAAAAGSSRGGAGESAQHRAASAERATPEASGAPAPAAADAPARVEGVGAWSANGGHA